MTEVYSFHLTKPEAEKFAHGLVESGAEGVRIGKKTSAGYPVFSVAPDEIVRPIAERSQRSLGREASKAMERYSKKSGEVYGYEGTESPSLWHLARYEMSGVKPGFTAGEVIAIARDELRKMGIRGVEVRVQKYMGSTPGSPYADSTTFGKLGKRGYEYKIGLYPTMLYMDEDYIRDVARHEGEHILRYRKEDKVDVS